MLQEMNRTLILNTIHHLGTTSRIEISRKTKLSQSTVSNVVDSLLKEGILMETGVGQSTKVGGRRPTFLSINPRSGYIVAAAVVTEAFHITLKLCLFDLQLNIVDEKEVIIREKGTLLVDTIVLNIRRFINEHLNKPLKGIGFSIPTVLDREGVIYRGHLLDLENYPFGAEMAKSFPSVPIAVEQEQHAAILGERTRKSVKEVDNLIYITVGRGIGASIIAGGHLILGEKGGAGEIGHMSIHKDGERCICGKRGCLRLYATELSFINKIKEALAGGIPLPESVYNPATDEIHVLEVYKEAERGEPFCVGLLTDLLDHLCIAISNLIYLYNPKKILVGGNLLLAKRFALQFVTEKLNEMMDSPTSTVEVEEAYLGDKSSLYGAAAVILEKHFLHKELLLNREQTV